MFLFTLYVLACPCKNNAERGILAGMRMFPNTEISLACSKAVCIKQAERNGRKLTRLVTLRQEMSGFSLLWEIRRKLYPVRCMGSQEI